MQDLYNNVDVEVAIPPITITDANTAQEGAIHDLAGCESIIWAIASGANTDANATSTVLIEEGDESDLSDAAAVADTDLFNVESAVAPSYDTDNAVFKIGYKGSKRYVRMTITPVGNDSGNFVVSAVAVKGHLHEAPPAAA